jgi:8-oxo-dGTP pyrophosphatase MutT (NUDIX family)
MTDSAPIRPAATILLVRDHPTLEVLMVKRHHQIDFASGALVFPGGKIEAGDHDPAWAEFTVGLEDAAPEARAFRIAALREAFEESALLLAKRPDGEPWSANAEAVQARHAVAKGELAFLDLVRQLDVRLDLQSLAAFARWIAPPIAPKRFDTHFFIAVAPKDQVAVCDGGETVDAEWIAPKTALAMAAAGERTIIFPTRMNLQLLAESADAASAIAAAEARVLVTVLPKLEQRPHGPVLVLPPDAGYGRVEEPLSSVGI